MRPLEKRIRSKSAPPMRLHDCALHLVAEAIGIDDRATLPGLDDAADVHLLCGINGNLSAGGDVAAFVGSAGDATTAIR